MILNSVGVESIDNFLGGKHKKRNKIHTEITTTDSVRNKITRKTMASR